MTTEQPEQTPYVQLQQPLVGENKNSPWVQPKDIKTDSPVVIALLNFIIPGLGAILLGQIKKGIYFIIILLVLHLLFLLMVIPFLNFIVFWVAVIGLLVLRVVTAWDGYVVADRVSKGYSIMKGECGIPSAIFIGLSGLEKDSKIFSCNNPNEAPPEWKQRNARPQSTSVVTPQTTYSSSYSPPVETSTNIPHSYVPPTTDTTTQPPNVEYQQPVQQQPLVTTTITDTTTPQDPITYPEPTPNTQV